jgi:hypothetical protein
MNGMTHVLVFAEEKFILTKIWKLSEFKQKSLENLKPNISRMALGWSSQKYSRHHHSPYKISAVVPICTKYGN